MIIELRGKRVIIDSDLAALYQVPTKRLMQQVKRNSQRFPVDFMFQLTREEWLFLKSQFATSGKFSVQKKKLPYVFTRNGANMVSAILKSSVALQRSIQIMRAFSALEEIISSKRNLLKTTPDINKKLATHSKAIMHLFRKDNVKSGQIETLSRIQNEVINLLQQIVMSSLGDNK